LLPEFDTTSRRDLVKFEVYIVQYF
jgi:hypothetical protein